MDLPIWTAILFGQTGVFPKGKKATESVNCVGNFVQSEVILIYTNRLIEEESEAARTVGASTKNLQPE